MVNIYNQNEIKLLSESGKILASVLREVANAVKPGINTLELDKLAASRLVSKGAEPAFLHYKSGSSPAYPASLCASINEEIVHCVPSVSRILREGDIISLDLGSRYKGLITDMAITVPVGKISKECEKLLFATEECLTAALQVVRPGIYAGDIGHAVEACAKKHGLAVVKDLVGHGVGHNVHEEPQIPNYGKAGTGAEIKAGMVIAIEPMLTLGKAAIKTLDDGWGIATADGSLSAHFEKTVAVTENGCEILT